MIPLYVRLQTASIRNSGFLVVKEQARVRQLEEEGVGSSKGCQPPSYAYQNFLGFELNLAMVLGAVLGLGENVPCGQLISSRDDAVQQVLIAPVAKLRKSHPEVTQ